MKTEQLFFERFNVCFQKLYNLSNIHSYQQKKKKKEKKEKERKK